MYILSQNGRFSKYYIGRMPTVLMAKVDQALAIRIIQKGKVQVKFCRNKVQAALNIHLRQGVLAIEVP